MKNQQIHCPTSILPVNGWQLRDDPWLTEHLGLSCCELQHVAQKKSRLSLEATLDSPQARTSLLYIRVPVVECTQVAALTTHGFTLVDTNITLERQGLPVSRSENWKCVRQARPEDEKAVCELAFSAFTVTRFHQDPAIDVHTAHAIQLAWVTEFFRGHRGTMFVAEEQGNIQGFHMVLTPDASTMVVDLIAVCAEAQGRGLANALVNAAQYAAQRVNVRVSTQLANTSALRAFERMGFCTNHASYTLHRHPTRL